MKKFGIAAVAVMVAVVVYLVAFGDNKLREEAKNQLNQELLALKQNGFDVEDRRSDANNDHFVLKVQDPKKIAAYLTTQGTPVSTEDIEPLKGMKVGADVSYLKDTYSTLSVDLYPVKLPDSLYQNAEDVQDKALLDQIQTMLDTKKVLVHIDIAKNFRDFKGYMKDIDQTFKAEDSLTLQIKGLTFNGKVEKERVVLLEQKLKQIRLADDKGGEIILHTMDSRHTMTGPSLYDMETVYRVSEIRMKQEGAYTGEIKGIELNTSEKVTGNLLKSSVKSAIETLHIQAEQESVTLNTLQWDAMIENVDVTALEAIQKLDPEKEARAFEEAVTQLFSQKITLTLHDFSIKHIEENGSTLGGLSLSAKVALDQNSPMALTQQNPLLLLNAVDAEMTLKLSDALFAMIAKDPRAMMMVMLIPPKEEQGTKRYQVIIKHGKTTVNGIPL
jgi:Sec-independent protein translocase protein TatA